MLKSTLSSFLIYSIFCHLWILCCIGYSQSCTPRPSPEQEGQEEYNQLLPQFKDGFQAILPDYTFTCSGLLKEVTVRAVGESRLELQLWRPVGDGLYTKLWGESYHPHSTTGTFKRVAEDQIEWSVLNGIGVPVKPGDVFGFYVYKSESPIQLFYSNSGSPSTLYHIGNSEATQCTVSLCGSRTSALGQTAPFIRATAFDDTEDTSLAEARLSLMTPPCPAETHPQKCPNKRTRLVRSDGNGTTTTKEMPTHSSTSTVVLAPTPTRPPPSLPRATSREMDTMSPPPGFVVKISPEAIVFIVVGVMLLVILVVLVFVLIACLRTKGVKVEQSASLLANSSRAPDVESVDGRVTASTRLAASSSGEHSMSTTDASSTRNIPSRSSSHHYINGEISHRGVFSSFRPQYVNSPLTQSTSHDHLRGERVWSTGALHGHHVHPHGRRSQFRARSVEPSAKLCTGIHVPPVPPRKISSEVPPTPLPRKTSRNGHLGVAGPSSGAGPSSNRAHCYSMLEASGDYADPILPEERNRSQSCAAYVGSQVNGQLSHEYAEPISPGALREELLQSLKYDRLSPKEGSPQFELVTKGSLMPGPRERGSAAVREDHLYSDPDRLSNGNSFDLGSNCNYSYVPTEDQRRMMNINHYEMQDDFQQDSGDCYDRLRFFEERETYWAPAATESGLYTQLYENKYRELPRSEIQVIKQIGSGNFGTVSMGIWENGVDPEPVEVAIKTVKASTELDRVKLLQEAAIMGQFAHCNVVRLLGVVTVGEPALVILEYMTRGDLRSFLQKLHPKTSKRELPDVLPQLFIKFSKDIANGMSYLSKKSFLHRDLAARNILLAKDLTCKIGDFGMARDVENDYYKSHGGIIPVKWTAPEALNYNKFSSASDVWSYGMVLFEIWALGEKPFSELTNPIVIALVSSKHCQAPPPGCSRAIYHLMVECWNPEASKRPTFDSIFTYLDSPLENLTHWDPSDMIPDRRAHMLGAPLREANNLYLELQRTYQKPLIENVR